MKIGIYKPFKKVFFHDDREDNAAWSYEVVNLAKILVKNGHTVYILSETDLIEGSFYGILKGSIEDTYDRTIIFGGTFSLDKYSDSIIEMLSKKTERLDFVLTDLALQPADKSLYKFFRNIYTMATEPLPGIGGKYGGLAEFRTLDISFDKSIEESITNKTVEFYFGGTERKRLDDFLEYVWRPGHVVTTKSAFLGIENRVTRDEYFKLMNSAKYSICIADKECNENHFMSPRPYECYAHDMIAFTDAKFDIDCALIPVDSYLRVKDYKELRTKMNELNENQEKYVELLAWQRAQFTSDKVDGSYVYNLLK